MTEGSHPIPVFSAILRPHRSLSRQGFIIVMTIIASVSFVAGFMFFMIGAWPVLGFFGLDVALIYWAFKASYASADIRETVEVTDSELVLRRMQRGKETQEFRFTRGWVSVDLDVDEDREMIGDLILRSRGKRLIFGRFLAPFERVSLADALRQALARPHI